MHLLCRVVRKFLKVGEEDTYNVHLLCHVLHKFLKVGEEDTYNVHLMCVSFASSSRWGKMRLTTCTLCVCVVCEFLKVGDDVSYGG